MLRLNGSSGSRGSAFGPVAQPPSMASASTAVAQAEVRAGTDFMAWGPSFFGSGCRRLCRLVVQELANQILQHNGRLRPGHGIAGLQGLLFQTRIDVEVLLTQQPAGQDLERT